MLEITLTVILVIIALIIISSLPLYLAVNFLGGHATIFRVFLVNIFTGILLGALFMFFDASAFVALLVVALFYSWVFEMGIIRAFVAWFLQYIIAFGLLILTALVFGFSLM